MEYDENRATLTLPSADIANVQQRLKQANFFSSEIGLYGRFHSASHQQIIPSLIQFTDANEDFQFAKPADLAVPTRSNNDGNLVEKEALHHLALRNILIQPPKWHQSLSKIRQNPILSEKNAHILSFGSEKCVPPSHMLALNRQVVHLVDLDITGAALTSKQNRPPADTDIAVIGMSCKVAGAENLEEFWDILCRGKSQHKEVPKERIAFESNAFRSVDPKRKWFANFMDGPDKFDHKFFKKSPRESATMDPQQRLLLQVAYQAVEQSGYFHGQDADRRVGCYIGLCATDYENNIACHAPNAFSATGNLQGFVAGKVSHHFGWTGPGLTIDTACSSSAVAVHQACQAILNGECNSAIAGGTHVMSSPLWFQNLAGASFLSTTGQCKPFDAKADGYCRGEGVGVVFLKRLSCAVADGDQILGVVAATGVQQNENCTPIFVPNVPSLSDLFRSVSNKSRLRPSQISVIEAHGTGTAVGDPAEYDSIRQVFGGAARSNTLTVSSVKGLVGHVECTSGIISMIKVLLMMNKGMIPPQASFDVINPAINAKDEDKMSIPTSLRPWDGELRAALVNNYGASGSNASMVIVQRSSAKKVSQHVVSDNLKYPFWLCGLDDQSLKRYSKALVKYIRQLAVTSANCSIADLAFNAARQSNRNLDRSIIFSVKSAHELELKLSEHQSVSSLVQSTARGPDRPVVLCFGGQISTFVGLDRHIYETVDVLRKHLDHIDAVARRIGIGSIYPDIFERKPLQSIVKLQTVLFAIQYACARSWIDSGLHVSAVVGHSFGELTSLCVSQVLSLEDALKMVTGRASVIETTWGDEKGSMMAVEAELSDLHHLLKESDATVHGVTVACYNGPKSFTLAGPDAGIEEVTKVMDKMPNTTPIRAKKLNVTNAFHSTLVEPLKDALEASARGLVFRAPTLHLERATEEPWQGQLSPKFVATHLREPVFFNNAIQRLAKRYPSAVFLEAGSCSTISNMASKALGSPSGYHFQGINITNDGSWNHLVDATVNLWKEGLNVQFWGHNGAQTPKHETLMLPPYQFDGASHWLELKKPVSVPSIELQEPQTERLPDTLLSFAGFQDSKNRLSRFRVNTTIPQYDKFIAGHIIANTAPICPSIVQLDLVIDAARSISPEIEARKLQPQIQLVENLSPLCVNASRQVFVEIEQQSQGSSFRVFSVDGPNDSGKMLHTTGEIDFVPGDDAALRLEFARLSRLMKYKRYEDIMASPDVDERLSQRSIYEIFSGVVAYSDDYRGLQKLVCKGNHSAGSVVNKKRGSPPGVDDAYMTEAVCQVGGIYVNCMTGGSREDIFLANGIERWMRLPRSELPERLHVLASHHQSSDKAFLTDVFAYDPDSGELVEAILGVSFVKVARATMQKLLTRLTPASKSGTTVVAAVATPRKSGSMGVHASVQPREEMAAKSDLAANSVVPVTASQKIINVTRKVKDILADLSGLELEEIKDDSGLADLGIDSLMGMEMAHEIETAFEISLPESELMEIVDMPGLIKCVSKAVNGSDVSDSELVNEDLDAIDSRSDTQDSVTSSDSLTAVSTPQMESDVEIGCDLELPLEVVMGAFNETRAVTDDRIAEFGQSDYATKAMPMQTQMCVMLTLEAFEELGVSLRIAKHGQQFPRLSHPKEHTRLVEYLYKMLEKESQVITVDDEHITRTAVPYPAKSSNEILSELLKQFPDQCTADKLTFYTGSRLAQVLRGETDGIKLVFGTSEGRELVSGLYGEWPLNRLFYKQMEDFLGRLASRLQNKRIDGPLKILEMGAGTGGTTRWLVPLLATLNIPVEYTFTDLAPSFVAAARKKFGKTYHFMKFRTHDIEKAPEADLSASQHVIIASNAVHATHSLQASTANMRKLLRPDGFLLMLEMTSPMYWVDMIFGLFEGWWLFDDGRNHAVASEKRWASDLQSVGYGHVDWTDGQRPENKLEKLIIAMASGPRCDRLPIPSVCVRQPADLEARQAAIDAHVRQFTNGFTESIQRQSLPSSADEDGLVAVVTGATGSLGSHIVASLARREDVTRVICLNRPGKIDARGRQLENMEHKGIHLPRDALDKLHVLEADLSRPQLGLGDDDYNMILGIATHIIHNAWLMNAKWPLKRFQSQFQTLRGLIDAAGAISNRRRAGEKVSFLFVSSIATTGHWPIWTGNASVPEEKMGVESVLPTGYGDAKYICELMLDETLHRYPDRFRVATVRPGQVAGSSTSGYWNPMEHLSFLIKSSQTLQALPALEGPMSWTPVDTVADTIVDLATLASGKTHYPIYHIDNPIRQPWEGALGVLAEALHVSRQLPLPEWVGLVKKYSPRNRVQGPESDNPAMLLVDFLEDNFARMSCGGLLLNTSHTREHSPTLARCGPVSDDVVRLYVESWKATGFLKQE